MCKEGLRKIKRKTIAQKIADMFDNDGANFFIPNPNYIEGSDEEERISIEDICKEKAIEIKHETLGICGPVSYKFKDNSVIIIAFDAWDIRARRCRKFCWNTQGCECRFKNDKH